MLNSSQHACHDEMGPVWKAPGTAVVQLPQAAWCGQAARAPDQRLHTNSESLIYDRLSVVKP